MPLQGLPPYLREVEAARRRGLVLSEASARRLVAILEGEQEELGRLLGTSRDTRAARRQRALLREYVADLIDRLETDASRFIPLTTRDTAEAHARATARLMAANGIEDAGVAARIGGSGATAGQALLARGALSSTFATVREDSVEAVDEILYRAVTGGRSTEGLARELRVHIVGSELIPPHLLDNRQKIGRQALVEFMGYEDPSPADVRRVRALAGKVSDRAQLIARHETNLARHEATAVAHALSPVVRAVRWNLSSRHPEPDGCDVLADQDLYGLGEGIYPKNRIPSLLHPRCLCYQSAELVQNRKDMDKVPDPRLRERKLEKALRDMSPSKQREARRAISIGDSRYGEEAEDGFLTEIGQEVFRQATRAVGRAVVGAAAVRVGTAVAAKIASRQTVRRIAHDTAREEQPLAIAAVLRQQGLDGEEFSPISTARAHYTDYEVAELTAEFGPLEAPRPIPRFVRGDLPENVVRFESWAQQQSVEWAFIAPEGRKSIVMLQGAPKRVSLPELPRNVVFSHNHPSRDRDHPLSLADLQAFLMTDMREIRAVARDRIHIATHGTRLDRNKKFLAAREGDADINGGLTVPEWLEDRRVQQTIQFEDDGRRIIGSSFDIERARQAFEGQIEKAVFTPYNRSGLRGRRIEVTKGRIESTRSQRVPGTRLRDIVTDDLSDYQLLDEIEAGAEFNLLRTRELAEAWDVDISSIRLGTEGVAEKYTGPKVRPFLADELPVEELKQDISLLDQPSLAVREVGPDPPFSPARLWRNRPGSGQGYDSDDTLASYRELLDDIDTELGGRLHADNTAEFIRRVFWEARRRDLFGEEGKLGLIERRLHFDARAELQVFFDDDIGIGLNAFSAGHNNTSTLLRRAVKANASEELTVRLFRELARDVAELEDLDVFQLLQLPRERLRELEDHVNKVYGAFRATSWDLDDVTVSGGGPSILARLDPDFGLPARTRRRNVRVTDLDEATLFDTIQRRIQRHVLPLGSPQDAALVADVLKRGQAILDDVEIPNPVTFDDLRDVSAAAQRLLREAEDAVEPLAAALTRQEKLGERFTRETNVLLREILREELGDLDELALELDRVLTFDRRLELVAESVDRAAQEGWATALRELADGYEAGIRGFYAFIRDPVNRDDLDDRIFAIRADVVEDVERAIKLHGSIVADLKERGLSAAVASDELRSRMTGNSILPRQVFNYVPMATDQFGLIPFEAWHEDILDAFIDLQTMGKLYQIGGVREDRNQLLGDIRLANELIEDWVDLEGYIGEEVGNFASIRSLALMVENLESVTASVLKQWAHTSTNDPRSAMLQRAVLRIADDDRYPAEIREAVREAITGHVAGGSRSDTTLSALAAELQANPRFKSLVERHFTEALEDPDRARDLVAHLWEAPEMGPHRTLLLEQAYSQGFRREKLVARFQKFDTDQGFPPPEVLIRERPGSDEINVNFRGGHVSFATATRRLEHDDPTTADEFYEWLFDGLRARDELVPNTSAHHRPALAGLLTPTDAPTWRFTLDEFAAAENRGFLQGAVRARFEEEASRLRGRGGEGLDISDIRPHRLTGPDSPQSLELYEQTLDRTVRALYEWTQDEIAEAFGGPVELMLARGWSAPADVAKTIARPSGQFAEVLLQPASSFSSILTEAAQFGSTGDVLGRSLLSVGNVDTRRLLATAAQGLGCFTEGEFVVLGGRHPFINFSNLVGWFDAPHQMDNRDRAGWLLADFLGLGVRPGSSRTNRGFEVGGVLREIDLPAEERESRMAFYMRLVTSDETKLPNGFGPFHASREIVFDAKVMGFDRLREIYEEQATRARHTNSLAVNTYTHGKTLDRELEKALISTRLFLQGNGMSPEDLAFAVTTLEQNAQRWVSFLQETMRDLATQEGVDRNVQDALIGTANLVRAKWDELAALVDAHQEQIFNALDRVVRQRT